MENTDAFFRNTAPGDVKLHIQSEVEACAAVLFACRRADEIDGPGGDAAFMAVLKSRNIFIGHDPEALIQKAAEYFEQAGSPAALIIASMGAIREQTRLPLFFHCLDIILADGVVTPQENKIFQFLKARFKVDDSTAFEALEVLLAKNRL